MEKLRITDVRAREVLDSRGFPTVETEVVIEDCAVGRATVPSGASTGSHEAVELRDASVNDKKDYAGNPWSQRFMGKGVLSAVTNVNTVIREGICGHDAMDQGQIDNIMMELDGTPNKGKLGANAILSVSLAVAKAAANALDIPLYQYVGGISATTMPVPMMNILNGGVHAKNSVDFQEFMIMPAGAKNFREGLRMGTEVYHALKKLLEENQKSTAVGDEGGFAPDLADAEEVFDYLSRAVDAAGYALGDDIVFAMDAAASELYDEKQGSYVFPGEGTKRSSAEMIAYYRTLCEKYPIRSIEDPLWEDDFAGWKEITAQLGESVQLVGDDLFVTNKERLAKGIREQAANSILIKVNQIGTLSETIETIKLAKANGYTTVMSHRSGETEDTTIADLAVAFNCGQIKTGAPCRSERTAKYNQLLRIDDMLSVAADYGNPFQ